MKHSLQLRLSQHLTLTPQLQQSIRLLQLSTLELNQELERFLQENPLLERDEGAPDAPALLPANGSGSTETAAETATAANEEPQAAADGEMNFGGSEGQYGNGSREDGDDD